jgi:ParB family chromosome partitioning protein
MTDTTMMTGAVVFLDPEAVTVWGRLRQVDCARLQEMVQSIREIGIKSPIQVRTIERGSGGREIRLVAGLHRLEAARQLGIKVPAIEFDGDEIAALMWEIAENLHRAELSVQDRADHVARWIDLARERCEAGVSAQLEPKLSSRGRDGEGRPESGINAASRELGIDRNEAQRAIKIAAMTPEAKAAAKDAGLDNNQSALLRAAKAPAKQQAEVVRQIAAERAQPRQRSAPQYVIRKPAGADVPLEERMTASQRKFRDDVRAAVVDHLVREHPAEDPGGAIEILEAVKAEIQSGELDGGGYRARAAS